jgi:hypothetical protein
MAAREKHGIPMTLTNMRRNGVHVVIATCEACGHKAEAAGAGMGFPFGETSCITRIPLIRSYLPKNSRQVWPGLPRTPR